MKPIWSLTENGRRVVAFDFTQKPDKTYKTNRGKREMLFFAEYHPDGYLADVLCTRCFARGYMPLMLDYPMAIIECPHCRIEGGMVRG